jgi:transcription antitermination factor NusG
MGIGKLDGSFVAVAHPRNEILDLANAKLDSKREGLNWYALQVHARKEQLVASQLENRSLECFLPTYKSLRKWSDRTKEIQQALFPGYVFCRFEYENRQPVVMTTGVTQIVGNGKVAIPIADAEIEALQVAVNSGIPTQPWQYVRTGEYVQINYGHLAGLQGILVNFKGNHRVVLSVTLLQRSLALEVELDWLSPLAEPGQQRTAARSCAAEAIPARI